MGPTPDERLARARACAAAVPDPEIPVVTLEDLGILRDVRDEAGRVVVELTPTYTGCPATAVIADDVRRALADGGFPGADVRMVLSPPWTTDWISAEGRRKLRDYGIAPPGAAAAAAAAASTVVRWLPRAATGGDAARIPAPRGADSGTAAAAAVAATATRALAGESIACPRCGSADVERLSEHGSTPCKALYRCVACREPFDYFKPY